MAKKEFKYRGKSVAELQTLSLKEVANLMPSRQRRTLLRGMTDYQKAFYKQVQKKVDNIKTHCRDFIILPEMVEMTIKIHNGKEFVSILIQPEMIGHYLGEFSLTRKFVRHSGPGVGATKSSSNVSVK